MSANKFKCVFKISLVGLVIITAILLWKDAPFRVCKSKEDFFKKRQNYTLEMCKKHFPEAIKTTREWLENTPANYSSSGLSNFQLQHLFVDPVHKLIYCVVPKTGCTNWKRIMMMLRGTSNATSPLDIPRSYAHVTKRHLTLSDLSPFEREDALRSYKKLIVVRHPLERLLSAYYMNKFESKTAPSQRFHGRQIIKAYRQNATKEDLRSGENVKFSEFVRYIVEENDFKFADNHLQSFNEHWEPINGLCSPCMIKYDYIVQFENLVAESNLVLEKIHATEISFPDEDMIKPSGTKEKMQSYYDEISLKDLKKLEKVYQMDSLLFNFSSRDVLGLEK